MDRGGEDWRVLGSHLPRRHPRARAAPPSARTRAPRQQREQLLLQVATGVEARQLALLARLDHGLAQRVLLARHNRHLGCRG